MIDNSFYKELVETTGSKETAKKVMQLFDKAKHSIELSEQQQMVYNYLISGNPILSQRQLARDCGLDHPQKLVAILAALTVKGYLVPRGENG